MTFGDYVNITVTLNLTEMDFEDSTSLQSIKDDLQRFEGGFIELYTDLHSGIATISLNRPEKKNALSGKMIVQLADAIEVLKNWTEGKGVILYSPGDCFCAGLDLGMVRQLSTSVHGGQNLVSFLHYIAGRLQSLPLITVALVQGKVLGGGAELVTACDFRLFTPEGEAQFVHLRMGVTTIFGGGTRLVRLLGQSQAMKILLSGEAISAKRAKELSFADDIIENVSGDLNVRLEAAKKWLDTYTRGDVRVVRAMKRLTLGASTNNFENAIDIEKKAFLSVWGGPAHLEAMAKTGKPKL